MARQIKISNFSDFIDQMATNGTNLNDGGVAIIFPDNKNKVENGIESKDSEKKKLGFIFYLDKILNTIILNYHVIKKISKDIDNKIQFHIETSKTVFIFDEDSITRNTNNIEAPITNIQKIFFIKSSIFFPIKKQNKKAMDTFLRGGRSLTTDKKNLGNEHIGFRYGRKIFLSRFISHGDNHYLENFKYYDILRFNFREHYDKDKPFSPKENLIYKVEDSQVGNKKITLLSEYSQYSEYITQYEKTWNV
jgi:hypothetical protein